MLIIRDRLTGQRCIVERDKSCMLRTKLAKAARIHRRTRGQTKTKSVSATEERTQTTMNARKPKYDETTYVVGLGVQYQFCYAFQSWPGAQLHKRQYRASKIEVLLIGKKRGAYLNGA